MAEDRRSGDRLDRREQRVAGLRVPAFISEHAAAWFVTALLGVMVAGAMSLADGRYWLKTEEASTVYQSKLLAIDEEIKDERRQIRIWTNYNTATPSSPMVPARNANIGDAEDIILDLIEDKQTAIQEWASEQ